MAMSSGSPDAATDGLPATPSYLSLSAEDKQRALADALRSLDLPRFKELCDEGPSPSPPSTHFFVWLRYYFSQPDTFSFYRLQEPWVFLSRRRPPSVPSYLKTRLSHDSRAPPTSSRVESGEWRVGSGRVHPSPSNRHR